ncbi:helix-turn-helix domain-containing protein [Sedimentibacter sp.]|uniref:PucR family transcriptional regulator n=1 Tax=Sedimentibacter sp. TaxID=1960295 RepID=UPI0028A1CD5C|nr:helix-turn-helix domain-containing protein [Sedimentibacter sp.]
MYFSEIISQLQNSHKLTNISIQSDLAVNDLNLFDCKQSFYNEDTIYLVNSNTLSQTAILPKCVIYYGNLPTRCCNKLTNSVQIEESDISNIFQTIKNMIDGDLYIDKSYIRILDMFILGFNLSEIITELSKYTNELIAIIDSSGKILAHTKNFHVNYSVWMDSLEQGYCTDVLMSYIEDRERKTNFSKSTVPCVIFCEFVKMYIHTNRIVSNNELLGYVFIINKDAKFNPLSLKILPYILKNVRDTLINNDFKGSQFKNLLSSILEGKRSDKMNSRNSLSKLKFPERMSVALIHPLYYKYSNLQKIQSSLIRAIGSIPCIVYQDNLVGIIEVSSLTKIEQNVLLNLKQFAKDNHVQIFLSNTFTDIDELPIYFDQTYTLMSLSKRANSKENILSFSDYASYVVLERIKDHNILASYCHPIVSILAQNDLENGTDLYNTLRIYTKTGFNKIKTAEILYVHRNTINYRIKQIESQWNIDLSDMNLLAPLQFSFQIDGYLTNILNLSAD